MNVFLNMDRLNMSLTDKIYVQILNTFSRDKMMPYLRVNIYDFNVMLSYICSHNCFLVIAWK